MLSASIRLRLGVGKHHGSDSASGQQAFGVSIAFNLTQVFFTSAGLVKSLACSIIHCLVKHATNAMGFLSLVRLRSLYIYNYIYTSCMYTILIHLNYTDVESTLPVKSPHFSFLPGVNRCQPSGSLSCCHTCHTVCTDVAWAANLGLSSFRADAFPTPSNRAT